MCLSRALRVLLSISLLLAAGSPGAARDTAAVQPSHLPPTPRASGNPAFAGASACARCHPNETARWRGSHHDLAMQIARESTVLGDFDDAAFTHSGHTSKFFRRGDRFMVRTAGPDGKPAEYTIDYAFGVSPLQQYLVAFPGGRQQVLPFAWDTRPEAEGGQRWFHVYGDDALPPTDSRHWTRYLQTWNSQCADCHSTGLRRAYDLASESYDTRWAEIDVSCEACHEPRAGHVAEMSKPAPPTGQSSGSTGSGEATRSTGSTGSTDRTSRWIRAPEAPTARLAEGSPSTGEFPQCVRCHSRRSALADIEDERGHFADHYRVETLRPDLYFADGQILEEVYVAGSFLQSAMYHAGVTCSDCHEPHSLALRREGNALCTSCHSAEIFDTTDHHMHATGSLGGACVECHMPARTYMQVDARRDHSLRVPRPDLSQRIGSPEPCTGCHQSRTAAWAARNLAEHGAGSRLGEVHYGDVLSAGARTLDTAADALPALATDRSVPAIVRASALAFIPVNIGAGSLAAIEAALGDPSPLVRREAVGALEGSPLGLRWKLLEPLLGDDQLQVRIEAARVLAPLLAIDDKSPPPAHPDPGGVLPPLRGEARTALETTLAEYEATQWSSAERPEAHTNLGLIALAKGDSVAAEAAYRRALSLEPAFAGAAVNLSDLYRTLERDPEGEEVLRNALRVAPTDPDLLHVLGLTLVRLGRMDEALAALERAARAKPTRARHALVYAVALRDTGQTEASAAFLKEAVRDHPDDAPLRQMLEAGLGGATTR